MDKIEKIRQEIEGRKSRLTQHRRLAYSLILETFIKEYDDLLSFLDTLQDEPDKGLEEEISRTYHNGSVADTSDLDHNTYENIARHFAQWGAEHAKKDDTPVPNDLEEAADDYAVNTASYYCEDEDDEVHSNIDELKPAFIAGAHWKEQQMLKEAEECELYWDGYFLTIDLNMTALGYSEGDKVRIIVLKEEGQK